MRICPGRGTKSRYHHLFTRRRIIEGVESICDILDHAARSYGDTAALTTWGQGGRDGGYTHRELARTAAGLARLLRGRGVSAGEPVALLAENSPQWGVAYFAIHLSGATFVPLDPALQSAELANILRRARVGVVIASQALMPLAQQARQQAAAVELLCLGELLSAWASQPVSPAQAALPRRRADEIATISFTSGTTGTPKGVVLTHRNVVSNVAAAAKVIHFDSRDRFLSLLPLNHMFEQTVGLLVPLYCGARVVYLRRRNPRTVIQAMQQAGITLCIVVPALVRLFHKRALTAMAQMPAWKQRLMKAALGAATAAMGKKLPVGRWLLRGVRRQFGSRMRLFVCGGAALDAEVGRFFECIGLPILQGYGLSETAPVVCCNCDKENRLGSVGRPVAGVEVAIAPRQGYQSPSGEVLVRGENVMAGYFENPAATETVLKDGWLHTGDIGWMDEDGYLYLAGRLKDVIIGESGKNVYPEEVEQEIARCECIKEACVLGMPASAGGNRAEEVVVLVVPHEETADGRTAEQIYSIVRESIRQACRRLAPYKRPRWVGLWGGELPKTSTLKPKKHQIAGRLDGLTLRPL